MAGILVLPSSNVRLAQVLHELRTVRERLGDRAARPLARHGVLPLMPRSHVVVVIAVGMGVFMVVLVGVCRLGFCLLCMVAVVRVRMGVGVVCVVRLHFAGRDRHAEMLLQQMPQHRFRRQWRIALDVRVGVWVRMVVAMTVARGRCRRVGQGRETVIPQTREEVS